MHADPELAIGTLYAFLMVLARVSGAFVLVPMPGFGTGFESVRIFLSLGITLALLPVWPSISSQPGVGMLAGWLLAEAALGLTIGLVTSAASEAFGLFGQMISLHSGHSFAATIDPNTQADSGLLVMSAQTVCGLLFFALGLHREVIRVFALSLGAQPPGSFAISGRIADAIVQLSGTILSTGLRLALPIIGLLLMVDLALALLGRVNAQLQLQSLSLPAKTLTTLALLAFLLKTLASAYQDYATRLIHSLGSLLGV